MGPTDDPRKVQELHETVESQPVHLAVSAVGRPDGQCLPG
jgi:hypothetical protein